MFKVGTNAKQAQCFKPLLWWQGLSANIGGLLISINILDLDGEGSSIHSFHELRLIL